jgi:periplasmic protein TonB
MSLRAPAPERVANERLSVTLLFAAALHGATILGLTFSDELLKPREFLPSLDVTLVNAASTEKPDRADYLAQANQKGGGNVDEKVRPMAPLSGPVPKLEQGLVATPKAPSAPKPSEATPDAMLTTLSAPDRANAKPSEILRRERPLPPSEQTIERQLEVARLQAEIGANERAYAKRPRRKFISANTREYAFASYMQQWVAKVERIGNLNYPEDARRLSLEGNVVVTVAIRRDGSIDRVEVVQSSGFAVLDDAALRIIDLAAPYQALPANISRDVDILHITRTWQFLPGNVLRHR